MPQPTVVCLQRLLPPDAEPFVRCVALPGRGPGLALGHDGSILWQQREGIACSLGISQDRQLMLVRAEDAPRVRVSRSGRSLDPLSGKLVVLLQGDELELAGVRWRVHVHGPTLAIHPPHRLSVAGWAAAAALVASVSAAGCRTATSVTAETFDGSTAVEAARDASVDSTDAQAESAGEGSADAFADTDGQPSAEAEAGHPATVPIKPRRAAPKNKDKPPIEIRDFPPYAD